MEALSSRQGTSEWICEHTEHFMESNTLYETLVNLAVCILDYKRTLVKLLVNIQQVLRRLNCN